MSGGSLLFSLDQRTQPPTWGLVNRPCGQFSDVNELAPYGFDEASMVYDPKLDCIYVRYIQWVPVGAYLMGLNGTNLGPNPKNWPVGATMLPTTLSDDGGLIKLDCSTGRWTAMPLQTRWSSIGPVSHALFDPIKREIIHFTITQSIRHIEIDSGNAAITKELDLSAFGSYKNRVLPGVNGGAPVNLLNSWTGKQNMLAADWLGRKIYMVIPEILTDSASGTFVKCYLRCIRYDLEWPISRGNTQAGVTYSGTRASDGHFWSATEPFKFMADPPRFDVPVTSGGPSEVITWQGGISGNVHWDTRNRVVIFPEVRSGDGIAFSVCVFTPPTLSNPLGSWEQFNNIPQDANWTPTVAPMTDPPRGVWSAYNPAANAIFLSGIIVAADTTYAPLAAWVNASTAPNSRKSHFQWRYR